MKIWKRTLSVGLALVMCLSLLPMAAFADDVDNVDEVSDAYYYVKIDAEGEQPDITSEDNAKGNGVNGQWAFMGKGQFDMGGYNFDEEEVSGDGGETTTITNSPDAVKPPEEGQLQTFEGTYRNPDVDPNRDLSPVKATVETFHNIGKYEYYDGTGEVPEYSYTVVWETATMVDDGFNFGSNECGEEHGEDNELGVHPIEGQQWSGYYENHDIRVSGEMTIHVDGTATLSTNPAVKVVMALYGQEQQELEEQQRVLKANADVAGDIVRGVVNNIATNGIEDFDAENFTIIIEPEDGEDSTKGIVGKYVEKTYTVTYKITGARSSEETSTFGKQTRGDEKQGDLSDDTTAEGTYRFTEWEESVDEDGNITYTAVCTFVPARSTDDNSGGSTGGTTDIDDPDVPLGGEPELTEIEDEAVPLAGLFTRADAIGYLWVQSGRPEAELSTFEDVPEDHEWAVAIGWAQDMGIAVADEEGNFRPDDLVLRWTEDLELDPEGEFEEFLNRYAEYAGVELEADELFVELGGEPDDIVMGEDAQVIFDNFFARLEEALAEQAA